MLQLLRPGGDRIWTVVTSSDHVQYQSVLANEKQMVDRYSKSEAGFSDRQSK